MEYAILFALVTTCILSLISIVTTKHRTEEFTYLYEVAETPEDLQFLARKKFFTKVIHGCINISTICILYVVLILFGVIV